MSLLEFTNESDLLKKERKEKNGINLLTPSKTNLMFLKENKTEKKNFFLDTQTSVCVFFIFTLLFDHRPRNKQFAKASTSLHPSLLHLWFSHIYST